MSDHQTSKALHSITSSPVSEGGPGLSVLPGGQRIEKSGREAAPASLSARQAKAMGLLTSGTYGPRSSTSLRSVSLTLFLASRLQARTDSLGSTLYKLTWKERITPSGRSIPALRGSVLRTSVSACGGWPTPTATDAHRGVGSWRPQDTGVPLPQRVAMLDRESPARLTAGGDLLIGFEAQMTSGGRLNPEHSRWLMGYTPGWDGCAGMETPSSPRKRKNS